MQQLTAIPLPPDSAIPDSDPPLVGYLVLAPAGTQLAELFPSAGESTTPPAPERQRSESSDTGLGVAIDVDRRTVSVAGRHLTLTYLEFELLAHLVTHPHRVYTREQLVTTIWGYGPVGDQRTVDVHVARLRRKLGAAHRQQIVTVRRVGYKYVPSGG